MGGGKKVETPTLILAGRGWKTRSDFKPISTRFYTLQVISFPLIQMACKVLINLVNLM